MTYLLGLWALAASLWGVGAPPVVFSNVTLDDANIVALGGAYQDGCSVGLTSRFWEIQIQRDGDHPPSYDDARVGFLAHELGHCLGFGHLEGRSVMNQTQGFAMGVQDSDRAMLHAKLCHRVVVSW